MPTLITYASCLYNFQRCSTQTKTGIQELRFHKGNKKKKRKLNGNRPSRKNKGGTII